VALAKEGTASLVKKYNTFSSINIKAFFAWCAGAKA
jgi:hypothetical protein